MAHTMQSLLVFFTLIATFGSSVQSQTTVQITSGAQPSSRPVLLLTGDSLTEQGTFPSLHGWAAQLQARYTRSADVITRGLSGYNTKWFLKYVMPVIEKEISAGAFTSPSLVTIWLGTNDAVLVNGSNPEMHVPIGDYKENLIQIVNAFLKITPSAELLLITPPHIDDEARAKYAAGRTDAKRGLVDRSNAMVGDYSRACVEVAETLQVPVLDLNAHFNAMPAATRNAMLSDGIHFNTEGHKVVDQQFESKLKSEFPELITSLDTWQIPAASKYVAEDPWTPENGS